MQYFILTNLIHQQKNNSSTFDSVAKSIFTKNLHYHYYNEFLFQIYNYNKNIISSALNIDPNKFYNYLLNYDEISFETLALEFENYTNQILDYLTKNPIPTLTITFSKQTLSYEIYDKSISYDFRFSTSVLPENSIRGDVHTGSVCTSNPYNVYLQPGEIYGKPISTKEN